MSHSPRTRAYSLEAVFMIASFALQAGGFVKDMVVEGAEALASSMKRKDASTPKPQTPA